MSYNSHQKFRDNLEALRIALVWKEGQILTNDNVDALKKYAGFGGLKVVLFPEGPKEGWIKLNASQEDLRLYPLVTELHQLLRNFYSEEEYKKVLGSIRNSVLTAFYTPNVVPQTLFNTLKEKGIQPTSLYEPSSGAGVFVTEAAKAFPSLEKVTAVEKDLLSVRVLTALGSSIPVPVSVQVKGFEETSAEENGSYDLIVSNIPFSNFKVYDETLKTVNLTDKIHNYFFGKGLQKIKEGGLLAFITTDAFLNNPSNSSAKDYVFQNSKFISLNVLPDNLMKDTGNTEAPSHLIIVQKNTNKIALSEEEKLLLNTIEQANEFCEYYLNRYIVLHPELILGNQVYADKNQYGNAHERVWQSENINDIKDALAKIINSGITQRFSQDAFLNPLAKQVVSKDKQLTFLPMPKTKGDNHSFQLGLFDSSPALSSNRATAYINNLDATIVQRHTARLLNIVRTKDETDHETFAIITAKSNSIKQFVYKLYSNTAEIQFPANGMNASALQHELAKFPKRLKDFNHSFYNEGEGLFSVSLQKEIENEVRSIVNPYYKEGTLVVHNDRVGFVSYLPTENGRPVFLPSLQEKKDLAFYKQYTVIRDGYLSLTDKEATGQGNVSDLRKSLNEAYENLIRGYGVLNDSINRQRILKDEAFGQMILASLERKEGEQYVKSDVLVQSLIQKVDVFRTEDPLEALAKSLNDKGRVDIEFIAAATDTTESEAIQSLGDYIYLNPQNGA